MFKEFNKLNKTLDKIKCSNCKANIKYMEEYELRKTIKDLNNICFKKDKQIKKLEEELEELKESYIRLNKSKN